MAKQTIRKEQYSLKDYNQGQKPATIFKSGTANLTIGGAGDYSVNTGVAKFPNGILVSMAYGGWPTGSWGCETRGWTKPYQGTTNIQFDVHYEGPAQTVIYRWWALGW